MTAENAKLRSQHQQFLVAHEIHKHEVAVMQEKQAAQKQEQETYQQANDARMETFMAFMQQQQAQQHSSVILPSQPSFSPMRKQRRTDSIVTPRQGDDMSDTDMTSDDQDHES